MSRFLLGKKIEMTQIFEEDGKVIPVTVVRTGPCKVVRLKRKDGNDKYNAVQLGFELVHRSEKDDEVRYRMTKPEVGHFKKNGLEPMKALKEFRVTDKELAEYTQGDTLDASIFLAGDKIAVSGNSKGRGCQGVMKRYGFKGSRASHGASHESHRHPGSIGASAWPAKVFKGKKMPGRMGNSKVTLTNLTIVEVMAEENVILIKGAVPGARGSLLEIRTNY